MFIAPTSGRATENNKQLHCQYSKPMPTMIFPLKNTGRNDWDGKDEKEHEIQQDRYDRGIAVRGSCDLGPAKVVINSASFPTSFK